MVKVTETLTVRVRAVSWEAEDILAYDLQALPGRELPPFTAGSHIDVFLPNGLTKSYSLTNDQRERGLYRIAVHRSATSQGGSRYIHDHIRPGEQLSISPPRNNFPLNESATHSVLIAGGIGITPLWSMVQHLQAIGRSWELYYCCRTRSHAAFFDCLREIEAQTPGRVHFYFDHETGGKKFDLSRAIKDSPNRSHFYCCGPTTMLEAYEAATSGVDNNRVHLEYFAAPTPVAPQGGFLVTLARSGRTTAVPPGRTILGVLLEEGLDVAHSCEAGICGSCETRVLEGEPEHRDYVLSTKERASNRTMMICCSGCKGAKLTLDL